MHVCIGVRIHVCVWVCLCGENEVSVWAAKKVGE